MGQMGQIKQMMRMAKMAQNPQLAVQEMMRKNPQFQQLNQFIKRSGGDPKQAFYTLARQKGVDPEAVLRELQS